MLGIWSTRVSTLALYLMLGSGFSWSLFVPFLDSFRPRAGRNVASEVRGAEPACVAEALFLPRVTRRRPLFQRYCISVTISNCSSSRKSSTKRRERALLVFGILFEIRLLKSVLTYIPSAILPLLNYYSIVISKFLMRDGQSCKIHHWWIRNRGQLTMFRIKVEKSTWMWSVADIFLPLKP